MPQRQCPWCGRLGPRVDDGQLRDAESQPHADGSPCVCRHVTAGSRRGAWDAGGRYYDRALQRWVCLGGCENHSDEALRDLLEENCIDCDSPLHGTGSPMCSEKRWFLE